MEECGKKGDGSGDAKMTRGVGARLKSRVVEA